MAQVAPAVESRAGRTLVARPRAELVTLEQALREVPDETRGRLQRAVALYVPELERILVLASDTPVGEDVLRCFLAHELVHALQHQYAPRQWPAGVPRTRDRERGRRALREGHAAWVGADYCAAVEGPEAARRVDVILGTDAPASLHAERDAAVYAWGARLVEALAGREPELVWQALHAPPPRWSAMVAAMRPSMPRGWHDPVALRDALGDLVGRRVPRTLRSEPGTPSGALGALFGTPAPAVTPEGGWWLHAVARRRDLHAVAFLLAPGEPVALLEARRAGLAAPETLSLLSQSAEGIAGQPQGRRVPRLERGGAERVLQVTFPTLPYRTREYWLATERRLFGLVVSGRDVPPPRWRAALTRLAAELPETAAEPGVRWSPLGAWLDTAAASAAPALPGADWRSHRAERLRDQGVHAACRTVFGDLFEAGGPPDPTPWAAATFRCAVEAGETGLAEAALPFVGTVPGALAGRHAAALNDAGQPLRALAVLDRVAEHDLAQATLRAPRLRAFVLLGRWSDAERALLDERGLSPSERAFAARALVDATDSATARGVLMRVCPLLDGEDRRRCEDALRAR